MPCNICKKVITDNNFIKTVCNHFIHTKCIIPDNNDDNIDIFLNNALDKFFDKDYCVNCKNLFSK